MRKIRCIGWMLAACLVLGTGPAGLVHADTREKWLEQALLQQLHPTVQAALQRIYGEQYPQYSHEHITAIQERVTSARRSTPEKPVDALHGQAYFDITVELTRTNGDVVELHLRNDTVSAQYELVNHTIKKKQPRRMNS